MRKVLFTVLKVAVSAGLLAYLVHKGSLSAIWRSISHASLAWFACGFAVGCVGACVTVSQWWGALRVLGMGRSYGRCLRLELAGDVFDAALPSSIGGDVLRALTVADDASERNRAVASVVIRRLYNFPGLVLLMAAGVAYTWLERGSNKAWLPVLLALAMGAALVVVTVSPLANWLASSRLIKWRPLNPLGRVLSAIDGFRLQRRALFVAVVRGCLFWSCAVTSQWCYMHAVGADHVTVAYAAVVVTVANMVTMLPIALGGYGLREGTFSALLVAAGMATVAQGVATGACLTAQTVIFGLIGLPSYLTLRHQGWRRRGGQVELWDAPPVARDDGVAPKHRRGALYEGKDGPSTVRAGEMA